jgi:hypothetical protein
VASCPPARVGRRGGGHAGGGASRASRMASRFKAAPGCTGPDSDVTRGRSITIRLAQCADRCDLDEPYDSSDAKGHGVSTEWNVTIISDALIV